VALPFKVVSSSQIKQGGIILRHLSPHRWTSGSNRTPQEGCGPRDRTVHHTVQGCPHHSHPLKLSPSSEYQMMHPAQVGLAEAQQIKAARKPNSSSAHLTQREAQSTQKTSSMGERVALPFKVASSSQIKQGGIILRHLSPHRWTSGSNHTPQEGCGPRDRTVHHTVQGCPHHTSKHLPIPWETSKQ
jgi:hypothetical protein